MTDLRLLQAIRAAGELWDRRGDPGAALMDRVILHACRGATDFLGPRLENGMFLSLPEVAA